MDGRKNNGGKRQGSGRPKKEKPIKKAVYLPKIFIEELSKKNEKLNFNLYINRLIFEDLNKF
ncbi:MAG: hypothetical protein WC389_16175 [Lutibacter sp.]|jgi:hypothetical protein